MLDEAKSNRRIEDIHSPPIMTLARRLEILYRQAERSDNLSWGAEISALEDEITENPATSIPEAAIQIMLASAFIERVREDLVEDTDSILQKMERLVRSALSAVVRESGVDLTEFGGNRYAPEYTNPFRRSYTIN